MIERYVSCAGSSIRTTPENARLKAHPVCRKSRILVEQNRESGCNFIFQKITISTQYSVILWHFVSGPNYLLGRWK